MSLRDVTVQGVERAMDEFDRMGREAFLTQFGFGPSRGYFLAREGRRYDSKAIVGVAHQYDRPDLGPLRPQDFAGGEATVARCLESLGFDVERPSGNLPWAEEELILALDLYLRSGLLRDSDPAVAELSRVLKSLNIHSNRPDELRFRNPISVKLKLANFAAIDPNYVGRGMSRGGRGDAEVWDRYASDEDALAATAAAIREGLKPPAVRVARPARTQVTRIGVEAQHVEQFQTSVPRRATVADRREQRLVLACVDDLQSKGHTVTRHRYQLEGHAPALVCDLVDETDNVLYEAKGDVRRESVRMAIGQLLDYRRYEPPSTSLALLLPRRPSNDLIALIHSVPALVVWRAKDGFRQSSGTMEQS